MFDLIRIATKDIKGLWTVLIAFGMAAAAFCLCFAGAIFVSVSQEEGMPYELSVSGNNGLKDADIATISAIPDVKAATLVLQIPVTIKTGDYSAEFMLTGVNSSYINEKFSQGGVFPDSSVMPYIILNNAACKAFEKPGSIPSASDTGDEESAPDINWLSTGFTIKAGGENNNVGGKVCGILVKSEDEDEQPKGYISIASAKELLKADVQDADASMADVRIKNIGCAAAVSQALENMGYQVSNPNEDLQKKWDGEFGEMAYLITGGVFLLIFTALLTAARRKISVFQQREAFIMLRWMGMKEKEIKRLFVVEYIILSLIGIAVGIIIALSLPSFLSQDLKGMSVYMLPIPFGVAALSTAVCMIVSVMPLAIINPISYEQLSTQCINQ